MFQNTHKRAQRRGWPIHGYVGPNGGGKSLCMAWDVMPTLEAGRKVLSTVRILDWVNPRPCEGCDEPGHLQPIFEDAHGPRLHPHIKPRALVGFKVHQAAHPLYDRLKDWGQITTARDCDLLLDEVTGVASSRGSAGMPAPVANKLVQLRRANVTVRFSAPAWSRADLIIRETAQAVTFCQGFMSKESGDRDQVWRQRRLFKWRTFDATLFDDFTEGKREELSPQIIDWHWGPKSPAFSVYDTFDAVSSIGAVTEYGTCMDCDGTRSRPKCSCKVRSPHEATPGEEARPEAASVPGGSSSGKRRRLDVVSGLDPALPDWRDVVGSIADEREGIR